MLDIRKTTVLHEIFCTVKYLQIQENAQNYHMTKMHKEDSLDVVKIGSHSLGGYKKPIQIQI